jgi:catechol 2,3-dioxygenase-like lactoylglutathione lyase family enzyme
MSDVPARGRARTSVVPAVEQLVLEIFVRDMARSRAFYERLGFAVLEDRGSFVVLAWEGHELFLDEHPNLPASSAIARANVRVMVADVEAYWRRALDLSAPVLAPINDRAYGLRDFTILDPDGFGLRFASKLPEP